MHEKFDFLVVIYVIAFYLLVFIAQNSIFINCAIVCNKRNVNNDLIGIAYLLQLKLRQNTNSYFMLMTLIVFLTSSAIFLAIVIS